MTAGTKHSETPYPPRPRLKTNPVLRGVKLLFKLGVSTAFLVYIFRVVDLDAFYQAFHTTRPGYYLVSLVLLGLNSFILAFKFKILMPPSGIRQSLFNLVRINFISRFYALFLTAVVGQGVIRWHQTTKDQAKKLDFLPVMVFERASFLFVLCLFIVVSGSFLVNPASHALGKSLFPFALAGLLCPPSVYIVFLFLAEPGQPAGNRENGGNTSIRAGFDKLCRSFFLYRNQPGVMLAGTCIAVVWHLAYLLRVSFLFAAVNVHTDMFHLCWMASLVLFIQILPVSVNGIGLREGAYAYLFTLAGLPAERGVLIGALFLTQMLVASAVGGIIIVLTKE
jgi:glycosyltransferase 2 family protein